MKTVTGRYNGSVVILDEAVPVDHEVAVTVEFPEPPVMPKKPTKKRFHWADPTTGEASSFSAADEVVRQRRMD